MLAEPLIQKPDNNSAALSGTDDTAKTPVASIFPTLLDVAQFLLGLSPDTSPREPAYTPPVGYSSSPPSTQYMERGPFPPEPKIHEVTYIMPLATISLQQTVSV